MCELQGTNSVKRTLLGKIEKEHLLNKQKPTRSWFLNHMVSIIYLPFPAIVTTRCHFIICGRICAVGDCGAWVLR